MPCPECPCRRQMRRKGEKDTKETILHKIIIRGYACLCERISINIPTSPVTAVVRLTRTTQKTVSLWKIILTRKKGNYYNRAQHLRTPNSKSITLPSFVNIRHQRFFKRYHLSPAFRLALSLPGWSRNPCQATHLIMITACSQDMQAHP